MRRSTCSRLFCGGMKISTSSEKQEQPHAIPIAQRAQRDDAGDFRRELTLRARAGTEIARRADVDREPNRELTLFAMFLDGKVDPRAPSRSNRCCAPRRRARTHAPRRSRCRAARNTERPRPPTVLSARRRLRMSMRRTCFMTSLSCAFMASPRYGLGNALTMRAIRSSGLIPSASASYVSAMR